jgi:isoleucyl-tRNA synthetase
MFPNVEKIAAKDEALLEDWRSLLLLRNDVLQMLEISRKEKRIGKALEAKVVINPSHAQHPDLDAMQTWLNQRTSSLKELFNVSQVEVSQVEISVGSEKIQPDIPSTKSSGFIFRDAIEIKPADGTKCERCWNYYADDGPQHVRQFGPWHNICGRCADALRHMPEFARWEDMGAGEDVA